MLNCQNFVKVEVDCDLVIFSVPVMFGYIRIGGQAYDQTSWGTAGLFFIINMGLLLKFKMKKISKNNNICLTPNFFILHSSLLTRPDDRYIIYNTAEYRNHNHKICGAVIDNIS